MPWVFLGKSPLLTGKCIISSHTDSACNQIHKVQLCKQLVPSDTSEWKPWYHKQRKMREVQTTYNQMSQHALLVIAKEVKPEAGLWRASVRNQTGQNQSFCQHSPICFGQKTHKYWLHTQNKKNHTESLKKREKKKETCQNSRSRMYLTEWKPAEVKNESASYICLSAAQGKQWIFGS